MHGLSKEQINLYQQYSKLGEEVFKTSNLYQQTKLTTKNIWQIISSEGMWCLPIPRQYGGNDLSWQDCVIAIDGFFGKYSDTKFLTLLMTQISVLYLISRYGSEVIKKRYLPRLTQGETASLVISRCISRRLNDVLSVKRTKNAYLTNNQIFIHAKKIKWDIQFFVSEKLTPRVGQSISPILTDRNLFIPEGKGLLVLNDLIIFKKLLYGIIAANSVTRIHNRI